MTTYSALSYLRHAGMGWTPRLLSKDAVTRDPAVTMDELPLVALAMPVLIRVAGGRVEPVVPVGALMGTPLAPFDTAGNWSFRVAPGVIFDTPFKILNSDAGQVVMVDESLLGPLTEVPTALFAEDGTLDPTTRAETERLDRWRQTLGAARAAAAALHSARLLTRWRDERALFAIDASALAALTREQAGDLHHVGALYLAHLSLQSLRNFELSRRPTPTAARGKKQDSIQSSGGFLDAFRAEAS